MSDRNFSDFTENSISTVFVTGASGFLGRYVVAEALDSGYNVKAVIRPTSNEESLPWLNHPALELVRLDLQQSEGIREALEGVEAVIHLAAVKSGDYNTQLAGTVKTTENLLKAMVEARVLRLVAISSFSVFDYLNIPSGTVIDENSPIDSKPDERDVYAQMKLFQEQTIHDFAKNDGLQVTTIRPGVIYGRDNLWNAKLGFELYKNLWIAIGSEAELPLTYVENCADAIVKALGCPEAIGKILNLVDDDLPTQKTYVNKLIERTGSPPIFSISWTVMNFLIRITWKLNKRLYEKRVKIPGIMIPAILHARFKPLIYSNNQIEKTLNWSPRYSLDVALDRSCHDTSS